MFAPVSLSREIGNNDYANLIQAANIEHSPSAYAILHFNKEWTKAARQDKILIALADAIKYDPEFELVILFDPVTIILAKQALSKNDGSDDLLDMYDANGVLFNASRFTQIP